MTKYTLLSSFLFFTIWINAQNVNIPDANFKSYLIGNSSINTNLDTEIQVSEASTFNGKIDCPGLNITDLTGLEAFINLDTLRCSGNPLTSLDISQNTSLVVLECVNNQLTSLDISSNILLQSVVCFNNPIAYLDASQNNELIYLKCDQCQLTTLILPQGANQLDFVECQNNELTSVDLSQNLNLSGFYCPYNNISTLDFTNNVNLNLVSCDNNLLTSLDISQNILITSLSCSNNQLECLNVKNGSLTSLFSVGNPNLLCVEVDNLNWSNVNWTYSGGNIDAQTSFSENCNNSCSSIAGIIELTSDKKLIKTTDLMGREINPNTQSNILLINYYDNGTLDKVFISPK